MNVLGGQSTGDLRVAREIELPRKQLIRQILPFSLILLLLLPLLLLLLHTRKHLINALLNIFLGGGHASIRRLKGNPEFLW